MADVAAAFMRGHAYAQAEQEHKQALEENKLRSMVLKHQLDGLKIEDQLRTRALQMQNAQLMQGQPEADMPTEPVQQPNLPSTDTAAGGMTGLPGLVSSLVRGEDTGGPAPTTMRATGAQASALGTNTVQQRQAMPISGVPDLGVAGVSVRPRSLEEMTRARIADEMMKPYTLNEGDTRYVGGQQVAQGQRKRPPQPTRASLAYDAALGDEQAKTATESLGRQGAGTTSLQQKDVVLDGKRQPVLFDPKAKADEPKYFALDGKPIENPAQRIESVSPSTRTADPDVALKRNYDEFFKVWQQKYPAVTASERTAAETAKLFDPNAPDVKDQPTPPTFEKWKVMTPQERQRVLSDPTSRIDDAEMTRRMGSQQPTAAKAGASSVPPAIAAALKSAKPGTRYKMTDGSVWDVLPDGTIKPGPK